MLTSRACAQDDAIELANKLERTGVSEKELGSLSTVLAKERAERQREVAESEALLHKLQSELTLAHKGTEEALKAVQGSAAQRLHGLQEAHALSASAEREAQERLSAAYKAACEAHLEAEAALRKKKTRARLELEGAAKEYEAATSSLKSRIEQVKAALAAEEPALLDFRQYYKRLDVELAVLAGEALAAHRKHLIEVTLHNITRRIMQKKLWRFFHDNVKPRAARRAKEAKAKK
jgi:hypothetical protein